MIDEIEEFKDLLSYFEENEIMEESKKVAKILNKKGIKVREHQWTEMEAS